jgi:hypothetical protein
MGPQGIFKPAVLRMPLSITTALRHPRKPRPYEDAIGENGIIYYKYRGTDPSHADNVGLREAMTRQVPLVYFVGLVPGRYHAEYPVFVVGDNPAELSFLVPFAWRSAINCSERQGRPGGARGFDAAVRVAELALGDANRSRDPATQPWYRATRC